MTTRTVNRGRSVGYAGSVTTLLTILNIVVGFAFQSLIAARLGLGALSDDFQLAWSIVTFGATVFLTLVPMLLVPRIHKGANVLYLGDLWIFAALGLISTVAQFAYALSISGDLSTILLYSAPSHFLVAITCGFQAVAYLRHRFALAALGGPANGIGLLTWVLIFGWSDASAGVLGAGIACGYAVQFLATAIPLASTVVRQQWTSVIGLRAVLALFAFALVTKFQPLLERLLTSDIQTGATAALGFGQKIAQGLLLLSAFGLALTSVGTMSKHLANSNQVALATILQRTIVTTVIATCVTIATFLPISPIVVQILFVRGEFSMDDARDVQNVILLQLPWVAACAVSGALTSYLYLVRKYIRVGIASFLGLGATTVVTLFLRTIAPEVAVPLASSLGAVATACVLLIVIVRSDIWVLLGPLLYREKEILISFPLMFVTVAVTWTLSFAVSASSLVSLTSSAAVTILFALVLLMSSRIRTRLFLLFKDPA